MFVLFFTFLGLEYVKGSSWNMMSVKNLSFNNVLYALL